MKPKIRANISAAPLGHPPSASRACKDAADGTGCWKVRQLKLFYFNYLNLRFQKTACNIPAEFLEALPPWVRTVSYHRRSV